MMMVWPSAFSSSRSAITSSPLVRVERAGRLVGEDDLAAIDQRARDADALLLAAGELRWAGAQPVAQAEAVEQLLCASLRARSPASRPA